VAAAVRQEAQGLPFLQAPAVAALPPPQPTSSDAEFRIADGDVEKALQDLSTNPLTADIVPEMQGWADSIRSAVAQGYTAARQGLDPTQRDKVIAIRRQLGEYGRLARFVGSLSPGMTFNYRRLGQALDETSAVLLVMLGESLASVGFASGYYLLQVPLAELQQRRDAVIFALRNFMGGAQQALRSGRLAARHRRLSPPLPVARRAGPGRSALAAARERDRAEHGRADQPGAERHC